MTFACLELPRARAGLPCGLAALRDFTDGAGGFFVAFTESSFVGTAIAAATTEAPQWRSSRRGGILEQTRTTTVMLPLRWKSSRTLRFAWRAQTPRLRGPPALLSCLGLHRLPAVGRPRVECRAIVNASWCFRQLELLSGADAVEQLSDQAERVDLIVVHAGRKAQQLRPQRGEPRGTLAHVKP
jgi:hypothetical protein